VTDNLAHNVVRVVVIGLVVQLAVIGYVFYSGYKSRVETVTFQRAACERGKLDRKDNADFQVAHTEYIRKVTGAASVHEDVKKAARTAIKTFERTSQRLSKRAVLKCQAAIPNATLFP
jgi:hypothetical protein